MLMHLKQLKLAGFKSFVDPTTVYFPSQLVAVLGPNGCGKSNIIDAVRWVMGEGSAKNLRGESMIDVIFNGSSQRKPVGQASVELIFDNSLGRLMGPFASYSEVAVKRVVTRDGESAYYLNNNRCRKRDITDMFLGTGAGFRGYSIIGQGTISRLIEAKPEELRAHLEEAAGVSKYKERRRETLQRIAQTQDNLSRVADIRDELDKQLQRLEHAAQRYTVLKEEEALCRAQILALKWSSFNEQQQIKQHELYEQALLYEQQQSALTQVQLQKEYVQEQAYEVHNKIQQEQQALYQLGTDLARLEEHIEQARREQKRLEQDKQHIQTEYSAAQEQIKKDEEQRADNEHQVQTRLINITALRADKCISDEQLSELNEQLAQSTSQWQDAQNARHQKKNELHLARANLAHQEQGYEQLIFRLNKIQQQKDTYVLHELEQGIAPLEQNVRDCVLLQQNAEEQLLQQSNVCAQLKVTVQQKEQVIQQLLDDFHQLNTEYISLQAVQKAAMQSREEPIASSGWTEKKQLLQLLSIEPQWQFALERVLGDDLHAYVVEDFSTLWAEFDALGCSVVTLANKELTEQLRPRLSDKIKHQIPVSVHSLADIYAAETMEEAQQWLIDLLPHESIITPQGTWFGQGWLKAIGAVKPDEPGVLVRQHRINELAPLVAHLQQQKNHVQHERDELECALSDALLRVNEYQQQVNQCTDTLRNATIALEKQQQQVLHTQQLLATFVAQEEELRDSLLQSHDALATLADTILILDGQADEYEAYYQALNQQREEYQYALIAQQRVTDELRSKLHQSELEYDRQQLLLQQLVERIAREQERVLLLQERLEHLSLLASQSHQPEHEVQERLANQLMRHQEVEQQLRVYQEEHAQVQLDAEALEHTVAHHVLESKKTQEQIAQLRLQEQELSVRATAIAETLQERSLLPQSVLLNIPADTSQSMREHELLKLNEQIKRLGAINLAAIDEFASEQQRKQYLDEQYADLNEAIATLQSAIDKMDKETRLRLEHTFTEVNNSFKVLFPRLFGGGKAQLELTCDNLLEAGIVVMAQPPGKRNSTIHLLSGGEKAMTAVALIFAIFQLNPSPFCMLDEVDAPLDDVNVDRFCSLVKEMSEFVQFLFITHNKVTMELADHLIGVTMREPGVSRLVSVDVKEALTME